MAFVASAVSAGEVSAMADDAPLCIAYNVLDTATQVKWTAGGTEAEADITETSMPVGRACDRYLHLATTRTAGNAGVHYFNFSLLDTVEFDCVFMRVGSANAIDEIDLQIADSGDFVTVPVTLKAWNGLSGVTAAGSRLVCVAFTGGRYTGTGYGRIRFDMNASSAAPWLYELWLGKRRQISRRVDISSPYDDAPIGTQRDRTQIRGGLVTGMTRARGFQNFRGTFTPNGSDSYGLDDIATIRGIAEDTDDLLDPTVVWIDQPTSDLANAVVGEISFGSDGLEFQYDGWEIRKVDFGITEIPPFARREPGITS